MFSVRKTRYRRCGESSMTVARPFDNYVHIFARGAEVKKRHFFELHFTQKRQPFGCLFWRVFVQLN